jgi:hypothetical protein
MKFKILTICLLSQLTTFTRPIRIVVADLLGSAKYIDEVVITKYDGKGKIYFRSLKYKDTLNNASCGRQINNGWNFPYKKEENNWTENQPFIGDTVLIIIDGYVRVKVYGKRVNNDFWSPLMSGSLAWFDFESPIKPIEKSKLLNNSDTNKVMACWDGCLIPINKLDFLIKSYKTKFAKKINSISLTKFKGSPVYSVFYSDTLIYFSDLVWTDEPPGKLHSLLLTYNNGKTLEIVPVVDEQHPRQFSENKQFDMEKFKQMKIQKIEWAD